MIRVGGGERIPDVADHDDDVGNVVPDMRIELPMLGGVTLLDVLLSLMRGGFARLTRRDALGDDDPCTRGLRGGEEAVEPGLETETILEDDLGRCQHDE